MSLELTDEERALIVHWQDTEPGWKMARAINVAFFTIIHKLQAGKMKAEFYQDHTDGTYAGSGLPACRCKRTDPRHTYTDEQWLEAAKKELNVKERVEKAD